MNYTGGVYAIVVTAYSRQEYLSTINLSYDGACEILVGNLDERLNVFMNAYKETDDKVLYHQSRCTGLLTAVPIYVNGDIGLCCMDYEHPFQLGNVFQNKLEEILNSEKVVKLQKSLLRGERECSICRTCCWPLDY